MQQHGQVVVECHSLLAGVMRGVIVVQAFVEIGLAFGTRKLLHGVVFLLNGLIGLAFHLMQYLKEVAKLVEIIRHPQGHVARGPVANHEAQAPIGGQAQLTNWWFSSAAKCALQVSADRSDASSLLRIVLLRASIVTKIGAWMAKSSSLRENTKVFDGITRVEGSACPALWKN